MDKKITKHYRREIWKQALVDARELLGARGELVKQITQILLMAIALGLIAMAGYFGWQGSTEVVTILLGLLVGNIVILLVVWLSTPVIARFYLWDTAAKRDEAQRKIIEGYENIEEIKQAKSIKFTEVNTERNTGIQVYNGDTHRTFEGQLLLTKINGKQLETTIELGMFVGNYRESILRWLPETSRLVELSHVDKDSKNAFIISAIHSGWKEMENGKYTIQTKLVGSFGDVEINPKKTNWILIIDKQNTTTQLKKKGR